MSSEHHLIKEYKKNKRRYSNRHNGFTFGYDIKFKKYIAHKPSQVLFLVDDKYYLIGTDEGIYFGCEMPSFSKPKTIKDAYRDLMPREFLGIENLLRQGEWFLHEESAPKNFNKYDYPMASYFILPKDGPSSNNHEINVNPDDLFVIQSCNVNGEYCGKFYTTWYGYLQTTDHAAITLKPHKIYTIRKNTAVRSVSEQGVD